MSYYIFSTIMNLAATIVAAAFIFIAWVRSRKSERKIPIDICLYAFVLIYIAIWFL